METTCENNKIETKLEPVTSGCTFSEACIFIESNNTNNTYGHFLRAIGKNKLTRIMYEKASFIYDEKRNLLLKCN